MKELKKNPYYNSAKELCAQLEEDVPGVGVVTFSFKERVHYGKVYKVIDFRWNIGGKEHGIALVEDGINHRNVKENIAGIIGRSFTMNK